MLRAFSSGCSALTGVEAVSNGVPAFRKPKIRNAQTTLTLMGGIAIALFVGLTLLALLAGVHYAENPCNLVGFDCTLPQPSLMAQVAAATFGMGSIPFFIIQAATRVRAAARGQHRVQRLPAAGCRARAGRLRAQGVEHPRRPPRLLQRHGDPRASSRSAC